MSYEQSLKSNPYPGRGIVSGFAPNGSIVQVYWIMGRSVNSRNRVFKRDGERVFTEARDPSKLTDPSLIIYNAARVSGDLHIVTNGDQTDTVYDFIASGKTFEEALLTRHYEPDAPNFTPRISCVTNVKSRSFTLAVNKTLSGNDEAEEVRFFRFHQPKHGVGHCIHTYMGDGDPLPSFSLPPQCVELCDTAQDNADKFWALLDTENRVALFAKTIDVDGNVDVVIVNA